MKKIFTLALVSLGLFAAIAANAQSVKFGIKGGLNVTDMHLSSKVFKKSNQMGGFVGPTAKFSLPIVGLGIDASALYDYRSAKVNTPLGTEETIKQQQLAIPVNLRYSIGLGSTVNLHFFAGPQWGLNIGDKDFKWDKQSSYSLKKSNFSVNAGLGVPVMGNLEISANYNIACGKTAEIEPLKLAEDLTKNLVKKESSRNNSWQIGIAYFF